MEKFKIGCAVFLLSGILGIGLTGGFVYFFKVILTNSF